MPQWEKYSDSDVWLYWQEPLSGGVHMTAFKRPEGWNNYPNLKINLLIYIGPEWPYRDKADQEWLFIWRHRDDCLMQQCIMHEMREKYRERSADGGVRRARDEAQVTG